MSMSCARKSHLSEGQPRISKALVSSGTTAGQSLTNFKNLSDDYNG